MSISVTCECGRHFEAPETTVDRHVRCSGCGREFQVPEPEPLPEAELIPWELESPVNSGKAIASIVLGCLFFFACLSGLPAILLGRRALIDIRQSKGRLKGRGMAIAGIVLGVAGCFFTVLLLLPMVRSARGAARRAECTNNIKQIGIAILNYHQSYGCLPPAAIRDKDGRPLLSWRVAIMPNMLSDDLHSRFHLNEPWDSPHNLTLLDSMPSVYACPAEQPPKPGMTNYVVVIGPDTAFTPDFKPLTLADFINGTSNTILFGETRRGVPWTKPEDLDMDMNVPLMGLGSDHGYHDNGFNVVFADGSVRFLKSSIDPVVLGQLLRRNGPRVLPGQ